jgi:hypothetical protein
LLVDVIPNLEFLLLLKSPRVFTKLLLKPWGLMSILLNACPISWRWSYMFIAIYHPTPCISCIWDFVLPRKTMYHRFFSCKLESEGEYGVYIDNGDIFPRVMSLCSK